MITSHVNCGVARIIDHFLHALGQIRRPTATHDPVRRQGALLPRTRARVSRGGTAGAWRAVAAGGVVGDEQSSEPIHERVVRRKEARRAPAGGEASVRRSLGDGGTGRMGMAPYPALKRAHRAY
jgi:hypothetical protein